jgi:hypothetical protein
MLTGSRRIEAFDLTQHSMNVLTSRHNPIWTQRREYIAHNLIQKLHPGETRQPIYQITTLTIQAHLSPTTKYFRWSKQKESGSGSILVLIGTHTKATGTGVRWRLSRGSVSVSQRGFTMIRHFAAGLGASYTNLHG